MADLSFLPATRSFSFTLATVGTLPAVFRPGTAYFRFSMPLATAEPVREQVSQALPTTKLPRPQRTFPWVDAQGVNTINTDAYIEKLLQAIEAVFGAQGGQITDIQTVLAAIQEVLGIANRAEAAATAVADAVALQNSYTNPASVISASSDGTVTIIDHQRVYDYADGTQTVVDVDGGAIASGYLYPKNVTAYYDDAGRAGGAVTYHVTDGAVAQTGTRHIAGQVAIPQPGQPAQTGTSPGAPGYDATQYDPYGTYYDFLIAE